jgi:hypothetical protein
MGLTILRDTHGDSFILDFDLVAIELAALWIDALPCRQIELPHVGCTGEEVPIEVPIGEGGLLVGTMTLIGTDVAAGQVDEEDERIPDVDIGHLTFPEVVQSRYRNPCKRGCVFRHRKRPAQNSSATFLLERPSGQVLKLARYIARAGEHPAAAIAGE